MALCLRVQFFLGNPVYVDMQTISLVQNSIFRLPTSNNSMPLPNYGSFFKLITVHNLNHYDFVRDRSSSIFRKILIIDAFLCNLTLLIII